MHQREFKRAVQRATLSNPLRRILCIIASAHTPLIPALNDVERDTISLDAGVAGHGARLSQKIIDADPFN